MTQIKFVDVPSPFLYYTETRSYYTVWQLAQTLTTDSGSCKLEPAVRLFGDAKQRTDHPVDRRRIGRNRRLDLRQFEPSDSTSCTTIRSAETWSHGLTHGAGPATTFCNLMPPWSRLVRLQSISFIYRTPSALPPPPVPLLS